MKQENLNNWITTKPRPQPITRYVRSLEKPYVTVQQPLFDTHGEYDMKIGEIVQTETAFPNAEETTAEKMLGIDAGIKALAWRTGDNGKFCIINVDAKGSDKSYSCGGAVVIRKLKAICKHFGLDPDSDEPVTFPEPVESKLVQLTSKKTGRSYYDLADQSAKKKK